jgi:monovalent cation:H+ antiporter-2, CPA2 family
VIRLVAAHDEELVVVLAVGLAIITVGRGSTSACRMPSAPSWSGSSWGATPAAKRLRTLTHPLRDAFGAIFFFHFGLTIDLGGVLGVAPQVALAADHGPAGASGRRGRSAPAQVPASGSSQHRPHRVHPGEFSLVLASLALAAGLDARIASFAAGYVVLLAIIGPIAVSNSLRLAGLLLPGAAEHTAAAPLDMDVGTSSLYRLGTDLLQIRVLPGSRLHGVYVHELRLPTGSTLGLLARNGAPPPRSTPPHGYGPTTCCWCSPTPPAEQPSSRSWPCTSADAWRLIHN